MLKALLYAYILGGLTFIPLLIAAAVFFIIYTSVPVGDPDVTKNKKKRLQEESSNSPEPSQDGERPSPETNDIPRTRKGWLIMRRTFEEVQTDGGYVTLVRSLLDSRSKDPKKSRPKDTWYVVLKGKVLYLYEDEEMTECEAAIELSGHEVIIYPEGLLDGELFAKRNAICLKPKTPQQIMPSVTKEMKIEDGDVNIKLEQSPNGKKGEKEREKILETEKKKEAAREEALDPSTPWFIFVRSNVEMEDWYFSLIHASGQPAQTPTLAPLREIFEPSHMDHLVSTLDDQPDIIPMRWLNALIGRIFFSFYRTEHLEAYIIGRLMKKLSKVKRPNYLTDIVVTEVSVGNKAPMFSKPMLKELTKEGDASLEVHLQYKGEIRITVEATATINLGARFKSYTVKLVLAAVLKELEGNLLIKVKRPPSNRIWYAFTQTPRMVLEVEPIVSDRQITWTMILSTIESKFKEIIQESVVLPNMDDIAFFDSSPYTYRGGIWSDASRKERATTPSSPASEPVEDDQSIASIPIITNSSSESSADSSLPPRSHSAEELSTKASPDQPLLDAAPIIESSESQNSDRRRNTWFSTAKSEDLTAVASSSTADESMLSTDSRGRRGGSEKGSSRSPSTHADTDSVRSEEVASDIPDYLNRLFAQHSRRSSSQHSVKVEQDKATETTPSKPNLSAPSTPRKTSDASPSNRPASPPSFFSTLKSKAGDKQAISNTAKEAMRKWGVNVNWGGSKKDGGGAATSEDASDSSSKSWQDSTSSLLSGFAAKQRSNYAEVRAAVAERKEREERENHLGSGSSAPDRPVSPALGKEKRQSASSLQAGNSAVPLEKEGSTGSGNHLGSTLASSSLSKKKSTPSIRKSKDVEVEEEIADKPKQTPIHVQPQAMTMTIPGIHASHRGEVMSMGHVAPQPVAPASSEGKLKNPTIQSVYRLWKSPVLAPQLQGSQSQNNNNTELEQIADRDKDVAPLTLPPDQPPSQPPAAVKPTPPPLPPRSAPIAVLRPESEQAPAPVVNNSPSQSASDVLKSIASKDEITRRGSLERQTLTPPSSTGSESGGDNLGGSESGATPPPTPPKPPALPPRRIQASA